MIGEAWPAVSLRLLQISFRQLPMFVEEAGREHLRDGCARFHFDDGVVAPERRAVVAVVTAVVDGEAGVEYDVFRGIERVRVDHGWIAFVRWENLPAQGDALLGPLDRQLADCFRDPFVAARIAE